MRRVPDPGGGDGPITTLPPQSPNASQQPSTSCRLCSINYTSFETLHTQGGGGGLRTDHLAAGIMISDILIPRLRDRYNRP